MLYVDEYVETTFGLVMIIHSLWTAWDKTNAVTFVFSSFGSSLRTSEEITVFLVWEVDIVVSVWMGEFGRVIPVILPSTFSSESCSVLPCFEFKVRYRSSTVIVTNLHGSLVSLVINWLSTKVPLLLLTKAFENVIGANLHDVDFSISALWIWILFCACLVLSDLPVATTWNNLRL